MRRSWGDGAAVCLDPCSGKLQCTCLKVKGNSLAPEIKFSRIASAGGEVRLNRGVGSDSAVAGSGHSPKSNRKLVIKGLTQLESVQTNYIQPPWLSESSVRALPSGLPFLCHTFHLPPNCHCLRNDSFYSGWLGSSMMRTERDCSLFAVDCRDLKLLRLKPYRLWLYLEIGLLGGKVIRSQMMSLHLVALLALRRELGLSLFMWTHWGKAMWAHSRNVAIYKLS